MKLCQTRKVMNSEETDSHIDFLSSSLLRESSYREKSSSCENTLLPCNNITYKGYTDLKDLNCGNLVV